ncbi:MAG: hypothetical protein GC206_13475 [Alphaproteobacteria bacterium]|nr:hypothetical protein [Alphaproteobacteria bacterium]
MTNRASRRAAASSKPPVNRARGEGVIEIDGVKYRIAVTMAALAEIEDNLEIDDLREIETALSDSMSTKKIAIIIGALIRAGGAPDFTDDMVRRANVSLGTLIVQLQAAFASAFAAADQADEETRDDDAPGE